MTGMHSEVEYKEGLWDGKLSRSGFIFRSLLVLAVAAVFSVVEEICIRAIEWSAVPLIFVLILTVVLIIWQASIACRRLNDVQSSRWFSLLIFVPLANIILWIWLACAKSKVDGGNVEQ